MRQWNDIFRGIDSYTVSHGFYETDAKGQKTLVDEGLKRYLSSKITELDSTKKIPGEKVSEVSVEELIDFLSSMVPADKHFDTLRFVTHYILNISSFIQGWEIVWFGDDEIPVDLPTATFNEAGKWDKITTNEKTPYPQIAKFAYEIFKGQFLEDVKSTTYVKTLPTSTTETKEQ